MPSLFALFQTLFHVVNKKTGNPVSTRYYGDALVVFHHVNAYEEQDHVVFDLISYKDTNLYDMFFIENMTQDTGRLIEANKCFNPPVCQRFVLPLHISKVNAVTRGKKQEKVRESEGVL